MRGHHLLLLSSFFVTPMLLAQTYVLDEVRVEGEAPAEAAPLETYQERSLREALSSQSSVALSQQGSPLQNAFAYIRGVPSQGTTVMMDGATLNTQSELGRASLGPFVMLDMEDVRMLPGTQVGQGAHPLGGVISMRTKRGKGKPQFSSLLERGSLRSTTAHEALSGQIDKTDFYVGGTLQKTGLGSRVNKLHGNVVADEGALQGLAGNVGVKLTDTLTLRTIGNLTATQNALDQARYKELPQANPAHSAELTRGHAQVRLVHGEDTPNEGAVGLFMGAYNGFFMGDINLKTHSRNYGLSLTKKQDLTKQWSGWGGYDLSFESLRQRISNEESFSEAVHALTIGTRYDLKKLIPEGEVKLYRGKGSGVEASYAVAVHAPVSEQTEIYAKYGRGLKRPLLMEKYGAYGGSQLPNPNLVSQRSHSGTLGVKHQALDRKLTIEGAVFAGVLTRLLRQVQVAPRLFETRNMGTRHFEGIEAKVSIDPSPAFHTALSYTMTRARVGQDQAMPTHIPRHNLCLEVEGKPHDDVTLFTQATLQSSRLNYNFTVYPASIVTLGSFITVRAGASWSLTQNLSAFARVDNLTGAVYETDYGYGARGRTFMIGGSLKL